MLEVRLIIHGRVQGVGYRYSIIDHIEANQILVRGYIRNSANGTVEIVGQGDIEALKDLRRVAQEGSEKSQVREMEEVVQEIAEYSFDSFEIRY
jgi:acylphosphatase